MLAILEDADRWPHLFQWFGAIPSNELECWLHRNRLLLSSELVELWRMTGGGDIFESETILRPTVSSAPNVGFVGDDIEGINASYFAKVNPQELYIFHQGSFLSAVRLSDQKFAALTVGGVVERLFDSLDEWYLKTLRAEFGSRYGLGVTAPHSRKR